MSEGSKRYDIYQFQIIFYPSQFIIIPMGESVRRQMGDSTSSPVKVKTSARAVVKQL